MTETSKRVFVWANTKAEMARRVSEIHQELVGWLSENYPDLPALDMRKWEERQKLNTVHELRHGFKIIGQRRVDLVVSVKRRGLLKDATFDAEIFFPDKDRVLREDPVGVVKMARAVGRENMSEDDLRVEKQAREVIRENRGLPSRGK